MVDGKSARLSIRVQPGASKNELVGYGEGTWRVRLQAPPVEGKANSALLQFLAGLLGVRLSALTLARGATSRSKLVDVLGVEQNEAEQRLRRHLRP
jgi:uncharacterized protein (TIGR00251 family)